MNQFWEKQLELLNAKLKVEQKLLENAEIANIEANERLKTAVVERKEAEIELKMAEQNEKNSINV